MTLRFCNASCWPLVVANLDTNHTSSARTWDLSAFGCRIVPGFSAPTATRLRIQAIYKGEVFEAFGQVANARKDVGTGIAFTKVEPRRQLILDAWIAALRNVHAKGLQKQMRAYR
jgi:hypothetical protein